LEQNHCAYAASVISVIYEKSKGTDGSRDALGHEAVFQGEN
jgi:hypothetical protein